MRKGSGYGLGKVLKEKMGYVAWKHAATWI